MTGPVDQEFLPVTIGRREWKVPVPMTFLCLQRAQEGAEEVRNSQGDVLKLVGGALKVIRAGMSIVKDPPALTELEATLLPSEFDGVIAAFVEIMRRSGFAKADSAGEAEAAGPTSAPSPAS